MSAPALSLVPPLSDPIDQREADRLITANRERWAEHQRQHEEEESGVDERWAAHLRQHETHDTAHRLQHDGLSETTRLREQATDAAFQAHEKEHVGQATAVDAALAAVRQMSEVHAGAHEKEHTAHEQRHIDQREAVSKAEGSVDKRLESMNAFREELRDQAARFATQDTMTGFQREIDRRLEERDKAVIARFDAMQHAITNVEKVDVKAEGRQLGQGAIIAIIVTAVGVAGTLLAIVIALTNLATGAPAP